MIDTTHTKASTPLFIIGNGFDLAHEYKTQFSDYLDFIRQDKELLITKLACHLPTKRKNDRTPVLWRDLEALLGKICSNFDHREFDSEDLATLLEKIFCTHSLRKWIINATPKIENHGQIQPIYTYYKALFD